MNGAISKIILLTVASLIAACGGQNVSSDYEVLAEQNLKCPDGAKVEYQPWGGKPTGMIAICKMDHGPYAISQNGVIIAEGENRMGKALDVD